MQGKNLPGLPVSRAGPRKRSLESDSREAGLSPGRDQLATRRPTSGSGRQAYPLTVRLKTVGSNGS